MPFQPYHCKGKETKKNDIHVTRLAWNRFNQNFIWTYDDDDDDETFI